VPNYQGVWNITTQFQYAADWPKFVLTNPRALFMGGENGSNLDVIDYIDITSTGNASDFGNLSDGVYGAMSVSSATRAVASGGYDGANRLNVIQYVTIANTGNTTDFGDLSTGSEQGTGTGSSIRGLFQIGVQTNGDYVNTVEYITIASTGNATDFGDRTGEIAYGQDSAVSSPTRGIFSAGYDLVSGSANIIDYVTISSTGNATDFGDLTVARFGAGGASSSTRGVIGGGSGPSNVMDYITIASTGNATDFGNLTVAPIYVSGTSNGTRGVFGGGESGGAFLNVIGYITIASTGDATDFGNLTAAKGRLTATSGSHGGIA